MASQVYRPEVRYKPIFTKYYPWHWPGCLLLEIRMILSVKWRLFLLYSKARMFSRNRSIQELFFFVFTSKISSHGALKLISFFGKVDLGLLLFSSLKPRRANSVPKRGRNHFPALAHKHAKSFGDTHHRPKKSWHGKKKDDGKNRWIHRPFPKRRKSTLIQNHHDVIGCWVS